MPLGALTLTAKKINNGAETAFLDLVSLVGPASYTTGGDAGLKAALQALTKDGRVPIAAIDVGNTGHVIKYDAANDKLLVFTSNGAAAALLAEFTSTGNLSATTFKLLVVSV